MERPTLSQMNPAQAPMSPEALTPEFWADAWTDKDGVNWELKPTANEQFDMDGPYHKFAGQVLRNGEGAGTWNFAMRPDRKAMVDGRVELNENVKGQGFATTALGRMAQRLDGAGVQSMEMDTNMAGFEVWPRMGFDVPGPDTWDAPKGEAARHAIDTASANAQRLRLRRGEGTDPAALYRAQQQLAEMGTRERAPSLKEISSVGAGGVRGLFEGVQVPMSAAPAQVLAALGHGRTPAAGAQQPTLTR